MANWRYNGLEPYVEYDITEIGKELETLRELLKIETKKLKSVLCLLGIHQSMNKHTPESILALGLVSKNKIEWLKKAIEMRKLEKEAGDGGLLHDEEKDT